MVAKNLASVSRIVPHFQRATRIDEDFCEETIANLTYTETIARVFDTMAELYPEQSAFIWTGSYGVGKSSMALLFSALLGKDSKMRSKAKSILGEDLYKRLLKKFFKKERGINGKHLLALHGEYDTLTGSIKKALLKTFPKYVRKANLNDNEIIQKLLTIAQKKDMDHDGLVLIIDEMGKFLEYGTHNKHHDEIYFLQKLAEAACRSDGKLILIGLLHQSFQMYSDKLDQKVQKEWAKVQGRYADIPIIISQEEQAKIISCAISLSVNPPKSFHATVKTTQEQFGVDKEFEKHLMDCWPLHPATVCLLSRFARSEYAQNQRSIFAFLNSREPFGFQEFLSSTKIKTNLYTPDLFWDYLKANLEPNIATSRNSHKWALVEDCIDRARLIEADGPIEKIVKIVGTAYLLGGLKINKKTLRCCLGSGVRLISLLKSLEEKSILVRREHLDAYAPFEGTDFDIEKAKNEEIQKEIVLDGKRIAEISGLRPILARRHGIEKGTSRYMEISVIPPNQGISNIEDMISDIEKRKGYETSLCGLFLIDLRERKEQREQPIKEKLDSGAPIIIETPEVAPAVRNVVFEMAALEGIRKNPVLQGDRVARAEVEKRIVFASEKLRNYIDKIFEGYQWTHRRKTRRAVDLIDMSKFASDKADEVFCKSPSIRNEILNRNKVSGSGNGALKKLMAAMLSNVDEENLGIVGYPAEKGIYLSVLKQSKLHRPDESGHWNIRRPLVEAQPYQAGNDKNLNHLEINHCWQKALEILQERNERVSINDLYKTWRRPPYGLNQGLMILLAWSLILAHRQNISVYMFGVYRPDLGEEEIENMLLDNAEIQLMWVELDKKTELLLNDIAESVDWGGQKPTTVSPLSISRKLVKQILSLPDWTKRTSTLTRSTRKFRDVLQRANDPNKVIFEDLVALSNGKSKPAKRKELVKLVRSAIKELNEAYLNMLQKFEIRMLQALKATNTPQQLNQRAENLSGKTGNFRLDAFIQRLTEYHFQSRDSLENILSLVANKPPEHWTDRDLDSANIELSELAVGFLKAEIHARIDGREAANLAIAWITTGNGGASTRFEEFSIQKKQLRDVKKKAKILINMLNETFTSREERLAAIAEAGKEFCLDPK